MKNADKNMEKREKLYDGITHISDSFIEEAEHYQFKKAFNKKAFVENFGKWIAMAACLCIIIVGSVQAVQFLTLHSNDGGGGSTQEEVRPGDAFMNYSGPVLPLSTLSDTTGILVERKINFDFSPYETQTHTYEADGKIESYETYEKESIVTDCYTLKNTTNEDKVITGVYGFSGDFMSSMDTVPKVLIEGEEAETKLYAGKYSGSFASASQDSIASDRSNLKSLESWEDYQTLLSDGIYLQDAMAAYPELNQRAIVYELKKLVYDGKDETAINPTMDFYYKMDNNKSVVMSYGSNGGSFDTEVGEYHKIFDIPEKTDEINKKEYKVILVLGEDISDIQLQAYKNGMWKEGEELEGVTAELERYEASLGKIIWKLMIENRLSGDGREELLWNFISDEMLFGSIAELMYDYGLLSENVAERYEYGMLEDIERETAVMDRILYQTFEILIPANTSVSVEIQMIKEASFDYSHSGTDRNGYDMMTTLGSNLEFISQKASVSNTEYIEIIGENFGFDLGNGVTEVELNVEEAHYYVEVRRKE